MKPLEASIQKAIRRMIRDEFDGVSFKVHGSPFQPAGLPDLIAVVPGTGVVFIEVKRPGNPLTRIQEAMHRQLRSKGARVCVAHSIEEAREFVAKLNFEVWRSGLSSAKESWLFSLYPRQKTQ